MQESTQLLNTQSIKVIVQYQKCKGKPFLQLKVIRNTNCDVNSARSIEQNER